MSKCKFWVSPSVPNKCGKFIKTYLILNGRTQWNSLVFLLRRKEKQSNSHVVESRAIGVALMESKVVWICSHIPNLKILYHKHLYLATNKSCLSAFIFTLWKRTLPSNIHHLFTIYSIESYLLSTSMFLPK